MKFIEQIREVKSDKKEDLEHLKLTLITLFREHIGKENGIYPEDILVTIFNTDFEDEPFKRYVFWDVIVKTLRLLRRKGELFTCNERGLYYVMKTQDEAEVYKDILKGNIKGMYISIKKADEWVANKKWRNI